MISMIIGGYMWSFIFTRVLYYMADNWGMKLLDHSWIGDPKYAFLAIIIVSVWGMAGYLMIIYMAALQGVPANLKEAAALDGANAWQSFWKVTLPMIRHSLTICFFWTLNSTGISKCGNDNSVFRIGRVEAMQDKNKVIISHIQSFCFFHADPIQFHHDTPL